MPFSLLLSLPFAALIGCGPKVTNQNIEALNSQFEQAEKTGKSMTLKEVESIMGPPTRSESFPIEMRTVKEMPGMRYYYEQDGQTTVLHFIDNKLIRRVLKFGEDPSEEKDRPGFLTPLHAMPDLDVLPDEPAAKPPATPAPDALPAQPAPALPEEAN